MRLLHYNPMVVCGAEHHTSPGIARFSHYFRIYNPAVVPIDRTGTIRLPVATQSLYPIPQLRPFSKTYEDVCNERASELLTRADVLQVKMYVFWSGGIDSTTVLVSLLKQASDAQKKNITVLLSEESISENPNFYHDHIHGKLSLDSSNKFPYLIGSNNLIVNGEHNDQVFGSDAVARFISRFGESHMHEPFSHDAYFSFFDDIIQDSAITNHYLSLFEKLAGAAPVPIERNYDFLWWINFALKWQNVSMRMLAFTAPRNWHLVTKDYVEKFYAPFFNTEGFQLWSMLNPDKKILDTWKTYKWEAKKVIYDYTKDTEYRDNKVKRGSLARIIAQQGVANFIDSEFNFFDTVPFTDIYEPDNDFA